MDLLAIPSDVSFATKASGDNIENNGVDTSNTNSFMTSSSNFKLNTKVLYKGTEATITTIFPQEDEFLEQVYKILNRLGKRKLVKHQDIVLDLLAIPSDVSFATKASGDNIENNGVDTSNTNSFMTSNSKNLQEGHDVRDLPNLVLMIDISYN